MMMVLDPELFRVLHTSSKRRALHYEDEEAELGRLAKKQAWQKYAISRIDTN